MKQLVEYRNKSKDKKGTHYPGPSLNLLRACAKNLHVHLQGTITNSYQCTTRRTTRRRRTSSELDKKSPSASGFHFYFYFFYPK
mmetsp:Transcript_9270/g.22793  ORF Transcript_9270/g.22793 Transcript_9270/m.22793 type:complete len:84 (+) Transcript_9270:2386-2637(+)